jgi:hypothetical protein
LNGKKIVDFKLTQEFGMPRQSSIPYIRESLYFAWNVTGMHPKVQVSASVDGAVPQAAQVGPIGSLISMNPFKISDF